MNTSNRSDEKIPKPYDFVYFPKERPNLQRPYGHYKYDQNRLHGTIYLTLKVQTSLHISTGAVVLGSDIGSKISLLKTMIQGVDAKLSIQGSSLKGCIRSVYEAISRSCICKTKANFRDLPEGYSRECKVDIKQNTNKICDACRIFGALNFQGLIEFNDANCERIGFSTVFMPPLYAPRPNCDAYYKYGKLAGRKFYYNMSKAIEKGERDGISVQQAGKEYTFKTQITFKNLLSEELGTLLIILGQDKKYPMALKVGGGKPIGMGTMTVNVDRINQPQNLKQRYSSYQVSEDDDLTGDKLQQFIQKQIQVAHLQLIQKEQLEQLAAILRYPNDRQAPSGMY